MSFLSTERFTFESSSLPRDTFGVLHFSGSEGLSRCYRFEIRLVADKADLDLDEIMKSVAVFTIKREDGDIPFHGILAEFEQLHSFHDYVFFRAVLVPKFSWLSMAHHNQVFLNSSVPEILSAVIEDGGLTSLDYELRLMNEYPKWEYICQYRESHLAFLSRWMEREGLYYYFEQVSDREKVIITDTKIGHQSMVEGSSVRYYPVSGLESSHTEEVIQSLSLRRHLIPRTVRMKDYNYRTPSLEMSGFADVTDHGYGEDYAYGEHFRTPEEGSQLAEIRAEAHKCRESRYHGESTVPFLRPGYTVSVTEHYRGDCNQTYLTIGLDHEGSQTGYLVSGLKESLSAADEAPYYRNRFQAIPEQIQFRPERETPKARVFGTMNARIDAGGSGDYAELDGQGRYKVILPFDLSGRSGGKASAYLRMAQPYAGSDHGMHFPLHKGTEVLLTFIDGDPDRPIIAAAVPNPEVPSVINDQNQSMAAITTGGQNKVHFEDQEGRQRILLQSPTANSWVRIGSYNDPPGDFIAAAGTDVTSYTDTTGTWNLQSSTGVASTASVQTVDNGGSLVFRLEKTFHILRDGSDYKIVTFNAGESLGSSLSSYQESWYGSDNHNSWETYSFDGESNYVYVEDSDFPLPASGEIRKLGFTPRKSRSNRYSSNNIWYISSGDITHYYVENSGGTYRIVWVIEGDTLTSSSPTSGSTYTIDGFTWTLVTAPSLDDGEMVQNVIFRREKTSVLRITSAGYDPDPGYGIRLRSNENLWYEAHNLYGEYYRGRPADLGMPGSTPPSSGDLLANFTGNYNPTGLLSRHIPTGQTTFAEPSMDDALADAHVRVLSMDTFNTQEGNIYDFGGYWNYNLGNSYAEDYIDQSPVLNATKNDGDNGFDLLDKGGPNWGGWTKVKDSENELHKASQDLLDLANDVRDEGEDNEDYAEYASGKSNPKTPSEYADDKQEKGEEKQEKYGNWNPGNVWVEKKFNGTSYEYNHKADSLEVSYKSNSHEIGVGGRHIEEKYAGDSMIRTLYSVSESGKSEEKKWCRHSGNIMSHSISSHGPNTHNSFDFNWANTASASINFSSSASFSLSMSASIALNLAATVDLTIDMALAASLHIDLKLVDININVPWTGIGIDVTKGGETNLDLPGFSLKIEGAPAKFTIKAAATTEIKTTDLQTKATELKTEGFKLSSGILKMFC